MGLSRKEPRGSSHLTEWMCVSEGGEPWDLLTTLNRNTASLAFKRAERVQNERLSDLQNSTNKKQADKAPLLHIHANLNKKETFVKQTQRKEPWVQKGSHNHRKLLPDFETKWEFDWMDFETIWEQWLLSFFFFFFFLPASTKCLCYPIPVPTIIFWEVVSWGSQIKRNCVLGGLYRFSPIPNLDEIQKVWADENSDEILDAELML